MSPTVQTSATATATTTPPYKVAPRCLSEQFSGSGAARAASPSAESVSSSQSNNSGSGSNNSGASSSSSGVDSVDPDKYYYNRNIVSKKDEALQTFRKLRLADDEEDERLGDGLTPKRDSVRDRPLTYRLGLKGDSRERGPLHSAVRNENGELGADDSHASKCQTPGAVVRSSGWLPLHDGTSLTSHSPKPSPFNVLNEFSNLSRQQSYPESNSRTSSGFSAFANQSSNNYFEEKGGGEKQQQQRWSNGNNVNVRSHNYVQTKTANNMAAEGDKKEEQPGAEEVSKAKPRKRVTADPNHVSHQFFHLEPCLYSHRMFVRAAQIFGALKQDDADTEENKALRRRQGHLQVDKGKIPEMDFMDAQEQIKTFELTFATLKFQRLFSYIFDYIGFFHEYSDLRQVHSLCYVILYDLQLRKFQRRIPFPDEVIDPDCAAVEDALLVQKTKLQANIAKERVKNHAPSIEYLLPEHIRNKDETKTKTPVYLWVNQYKTTVDEVVDTLKSDGFQERSRADMSEETGYVFARDPHCSDLLTFPPDMDMEIKSWAYVTSGTLVQQDKSSCLAPQSVPYLLGPDHDVIHVNVGTAVTTCHLASLLRHKCPNTHIFAFGVDSTEKARKVARNMELLGVRNVRIVHDEFLSIDPEDSRFKSVRVILISANCSKSAITSPVQFIVSEGEDTQILGKLSVAETDMGMVGELMGEHERLLKHALRFPKLQAVVYTTRSRHEAENDVVVTKVLEFVNMTSGRKPVFKVVPPVIPFFSDEIDSNMKNGVDGRFIRFRPSDRANGCFVAVIAKEPEDPRDLSRAALARSKSKGMLNKSKSAASGLGDEAHKEDKSGKSKGGRKNAKSGGTSQQEIKTSGSANSLKSKLSQHKAASGAGARLYQAGLIKKMETSGRSSPAKPEHLRVIKHPAPFRDSDVEVDNEQ